MVSFQLSDEERMLQGLAHEFAEQEIRPTANKYYRDDRRIPEELLDGLIRRANELRLLDFYYPEEMGGLGMESRFLACLIAEELTWGDAGIAVHLQASSLAAKAIASMATPEQKKRFLTGITNPEGRAVLPRIACFCLTEPGAGSHVLDLATTAVRDGDHFVINGTKMFITNGGRSDIYVVIAQTNPGADHKLEKAMGLGGFIVEKGTPGLSFSADLKKWGVLASNTTEVVFENVRVPLENRLGGEEGQSAGGMLGVYETLEATRVGVGASALGIARAAFETALAYAKTRVQKKPIIEFQAISHKLADLETEINAGRMLVWLAASMLDEGQPLTRGQGSQAKLFCTELAVRCCAEAVQIHGGYGFIKEYDVGRWLNDAMVFRIWEGTSEIQKNTIARYLSGL